MSASTRYIMYVPHNCPVSILKTWLYLSRLPAVDEALRVVELSVRPVPPEVLPGGFQGRQREDHTDGDQSYLWLKGVDYGDKVQNSQAHKVYVSQMVKRLKEVHGDEQEDGVFSGLDGIAKEVAVGLLRIPQDLIRQIGHQVADVLFPCSLTSQSISDLVQRTLQSHSCSECFSFPLLINFSSPSSQYSKLLWGKSTLCRVSFNEPFLCVCVCVCEV